MFLEFWKRKQAEIAYEWDLLGYEDEEVLHVIHSRYAMEYIPLTNCKLRTEFFLVRLWPKREARWP